MLLRMITILALTISSTLMCMEDSNNNTNNAQKEEIDYNSDDEVKINGKVTDKDIEDFLQSKNTRSVQQAAATYMNFVEQHYHQLKLGSTQKPNQQNNTTTSLEEFKKAVATKSLKSGKTESMSSTDYLKTSEYGIQNAGE